MGERNARVVEQSTVRLDALKWTWSPGSLPGHASDVVLRTSVVGNSGVTSKGGSLLMTGLTMSLLATLALIAALLIVATLVFRKRTFD